MAETATTPSTEEMAQLHIHDRHTELGLSGDDLVGMYRTILLSRVLDQKIWGLNRMGKAAFVVSGQGHEGAQVGAGWAIRAGVDLVLPYYRDIALMLTVGMTPLEVMLGVFARADDPNTGGRQMPNHWGCRRLNVITGSSPIATQIPHAAGLALAERLQGRDGVAVTFFGEGATARGDFHEAMNFAGIHRLPVVFVCENNGYAISVPMSKESAVENVAERAHAYGFAGLIVDGNDPIDVYSAMQTALRRASSNEGPTLVECKTYRYLAHTSDDDDRTYRSPEEVEAWRKKDPLQRIKQYLIEQRLLPANREKEIDEETREIVDRAAKEAEAAPAPDAGGAFTKVFARPVRPIPRVPEGAGDPLADDVVTTSPSLPPAEECTEKNIIETVRDTLDSLLETDDRVMVMGEDVGPRGGVFRATDGLIGKYGEDRVIDTPLAESSIVGIAIGLAMGGMRPIAEIQFADFIHAAFDQLVSEAAKIHYRSNGDFQVPMVVRAPWGGGVHGALYHSQSIEAFYSHVAGLKVVAPSTPADVAGLLRESVADPDPVLFLEHKKTYRLVKGPVPNDPGWRVPIGVAQIARPGTDASIVTYGLHRHLAIEAAEALADEGLGNVEVIDLRTISPLDTDTVLESARRTGRVLVVHEDNISFGVGAEVAAVVAEEAFYELDAPVRRLAMPDVPAMPFAGAMEAAVMITAADVKAAAASLLRE